MPDETLMFDLQAFLDRNFQRNPQGMAHRRKEFLNNVPYESCTAIELLRRAQAELRRLYAQQRTLALASLDADLREEMELRGVEQ